MTTKIIISLLAIFYFQVSFAKNSQCLDLFPAKKTRDDQVTAPDFGRPISIVVDGTTFTGRRGVEMEARLSIPMESISNIGKTSFIVDGPLGNVLAAGYPSWVVQDGQRKLYDLALTLAQEQYSFAAYSQQSFLELSRKDPIVRERLQTFAAHSSNYKEDNSFSISALGQSGQEQWHESDPYRKGKKSESAGVLSTRLFGPERRNAGVDTTVQTSYTVGAQREVTHYFELEGFTSHYLRWKVWYAIDGTTPVRASVFLKEKPTQQEISQIQLVNRDQAYIAIPPASTLEQAKIFLAALIQKEGGTSLEVSEKDLTISGVVQTERLAFKLLGKNPIGFLIADLVTYLDEAGAPISPPTTAIEIGLHKEFANKISEDFAKRNEFNQPFFELETKTHDGWWKTADFVSDSPSFSWMVFMQSLQNLFPGSAWKTGTPKARRFSN